MRGEWAEVLARFCDDKMPALEVCAREAIAESVVVPAASLREVQTWLERTRHHLTVCCQTNAN
jgi:cyclic beta-1,2-glucan synthetase